MPNKKQLRRWVENEEFEQIEQYATQQNPTNSELLTFYHRGISYERSALEKQTLDQLIKRRIVPDEMALIQLTRMASDGFAEHAVALLRLGVTPSSLPTPDSASTSYPERTLLRCLLTNNLHDHAQSCLDALRSLDSNYLILAAEGACHGPQCLRLVRDELGYDDSTVVSAFTRYIDSVKEYGRVGANRVVLDIFRELGLFERDYYSIVLDVMTDKLLVEEVEFKTFRALVEYGLQHTTPSQGQLDRLYDRFVAADSFFVDEKKQLIRTLTDHGLYPSVDFLRTRSVSATSTEINRYLRGRLTGRQRRALDQLERKIA